MDGIGRELAVTGAVRFSGVLVASLARLENAVAGLSPESAGTRLQAIEPLKEMLSADGCIGAIPAQFLGARAKPVRAVLFNKTAETNWSLAWHQDRTICVKAKREVIGYGPWTVKQGLVHVAPPVELLAKMITVRVHLDDVPETNAPLIIAPGSHREGMVPVGMIGETVARFGTATCLADAGDIGVIQPLSCMPQPQPKTPGPGGYFKQITPPLICQGALSGRVYDARLKQQIFYCGWGSADS